MSKSTNESPVTEATQLNVAPEPEKITRTQRAKNFVKRHKKASIAVASLGTLVVVSSLVGRKSDQAPSEFITDNFEPELEETPDTTVA